MAPAHPYQMLLSSWLDGCKTYTISEACDLQDRLDSMSYGMSGKYHIKWRNAKTGAPIVIGRTGGTGYSKKTKKKKIINPFTQATQKQIFSNLSRIHSNKLR